MNPIIEKIISLQNEIIKGESDLSKKIKEQRVLLNQLTEEEEPEVLKTMQQMWRDHQKENPYL